ncbi:guanylate kinase [Psittacicella gerlachiana]|uniref:Guanylate kinase n=1 Tax=Psittacicella gerlachiana TaxID=2028574 RepID=A0A3A1Y6B2_9GAMM|nr:guanylate kinase [Psittacicella gerlachiana]RIY33803.1 guanylate kinase [Psittacicella gerlachiana]
MTEKIKKGHLFIISAPSGAGKSTLITKLLKSNLASKYYLSISHTTRPVRPGEQHGVHYFFTNIENFENLIQNDEFLEYAEVFGNYYGTSKRIIREKLEQGINIILDIDWQGARNVRKQFPEAISIFILPPSIEELKQRLLNRQTDSLDVIERRMAKAENEMAHKHEYDYEILNDDLDHAYAQFVQLLESYAKK